MGRPRQAEAAQGSAQVVGLAREQRAAGPLANPSRSLTTCRGDATHVTCDDVGAQTPRLAPRSCVFDAHGWSIPYREQEHSTHLAEYAGLPGRLSSSSYRLLVLKHQSKIHAN